ncbi:hypothetical protein TRICI_002625 [Trichomonascus ciferrii]|uniref:CS domain-containing protein n=1 Tax=Trichomonascus ciferrii TaxID=44093 RepID=A0A642V5I0_9ASCO|nr:hypothetical protein TRICI_002625 [Trichomonascus ciferrii]
MLTPQFSVDQDEKNVYIDIKAPFIRTQDVEFFVDGELFIFSLHPYYLRLRFPGRLKQDDDEEQDESKLSNASYDIASSTVKIRVPKETAGEEFKDLDMITKLLARKDEPTKEKAGTKPLIQEIGGTSNKAEEIAELGEKFDWEIEQKVESNVSSNLGSKYGFDDQYSGEIGVSVMNGNSINELGDPENSTVESRSSERVSLEDHKFDPDHYLADFMDNPEISEFINWSNPMLGSAYDFRFNSEEKDLLAKLPKKSYILSAPKITYINLVSIVFAYVFDCCTTMDDHTVESAWTIGKLIPAVSCLDTNFSTLHSIVIACTRRALAYPLYRHWKLVQKVWDDVYRLLKLASNDKKVIVKVLLRVVKIFDTSDACHSVYNRILFHDYSAWVQHANEVVIRSLAHDLRKTLETLNKSSLNWLIPELEEAAVEAAQEG